MYYLFADERRKELARLPVLPPTKQSTRPAAAVENSLPQDRDREKCYCQDKREHARSNAQLRQAGTFGFVAAIENSLPPVTVV
jgi:hypothetical protein